MAKTERPDLAAMIAPHGSAQMAAQRGRPGGPASRAPLPGHRAAARGRGPGAPGRAPRRSPH
uniref:hypothetical protein n=1 Tax=Nocardia wallacei TaxID=480035 RepID=UPI0024553445